MIYTECANSLQGPTEAISNPSPIEQVIDTDRPKDHCIDRVHEITKFWEIEACDLAIHLSTLCVHTDTSSKLTAMSSALLITA